MINGKLLDQKIKEKNLSRKQLAEVMGLKQCSLSLKMSNKRQMALDEVEIITNKLQLTNDEMRAIFFAN